MRLTSTFSGIQNSFFVEIFEKPGKSLYYSIAMYSYYMLLNLVIQISMNVYIVSCVISEYLLKDLTRLMPKIVRTIKKIYLGIKYNCT